MTPTQDKDQAAKADPSKAKSEAASSDTPPRDPTQAIPEIALKRYLTTGPDGAAGYSNPQL